MLKIEVNEGHVSVDQKGRADDVMYEFLCAMLVVYHDWNNIDKRLGECFKRMIATAANPEAGFWDIKAETVSGMSVTAIIPHLRKDGESYGK